MESWIVTHEGALRLGLFLGLLASFSLAEAHAPRRARQTSRLRRWPTNLAVSAVGALLLRLIAPAAASGAALWAEAGGWGLLNQWETPRAVGIVATVVVFDGLIYGQHVLSHRIPLFWRLHQVHHADRDIDATTAIRFHPLEILLSMGLKVAAIVAFGAPVEGVILFEIVLNGAAIFNHANLALPPSADRALRRAIVTPDMHRVHHSTIRRETDANFGFFLSVWDRAFGTYRDAPQKGHDGMTIGLAEYQDGRPARLDWALAAPFLAAPRTNAPRPDSEEAA